MKYIKNIFLSVISLVFISIVALIYAALYNIQSHNNSHYDSIDEFRADINKWKVIGKTDKVARSIFEEKGFKCHGGPEMYIGNMCYRDLPGLPCNQRLRVMLLTDDNMLVNSVSIWEINGSFPRQCL